MSEFLSETTEAAYNPISPLESSFVADCTL